MKTSDRTIALLRLFTVERSEWTVEEVAIELGMTISTAYRYVRSLGENGFISSYSKGKYVLGPAFMKYDRQIRLCDPLLSAAGPVMNALANELPPATVVLLCKVYDTEVMCIDQRQPKNTDFASTYERGRPMPLQFGAASKVILANLPARVAKALYGREPEQMARAGLGMDWKQVSKSLRAIRNAGAFSTEGELHQGMQGIAAPILTDGRHAVGSIATVRAAGGPAETTQEIKELLSQASARIVEVMQS
jgi:DNA-binding IclR family transcriptional regulator